ncbi:hypothetical protein GM708_11795 [Vibrio cholerae]|nr:hypothetical protein [Vibrio cholerae]
MTTEKPAPDTNEWDLLGAWLADVQGLSSDTYAYPLAPESLLAGDELGVPGTPGPAAVVRTLLDASVDNLGAAFDLVTQAGRLSPIGIPTLVRGTIELSGLGMWVLTGHERTGRQERALRVGHDSMINEAKFHTERSQRPGLSDEDKNAAAQSAADQKKAAADLADAAGKAGLKKTRVTATLNRTDALREVDKARDSDFLPLWQLCSGFAHGLAWAPALFHTPVRTHTMEGGGTITASVFDQDRALMMLQWGKHALEELRGTFAAGRSMTGDPTATLVSMPREKMETEARAKGIEIGYQITLPPPRRPDGGTFYSAQLDNPKG